MLLLLFAETLDASFATAFGGGAAGAAAAGSDSDSDEEPVKKFTIKISDTPVEGAIHTQSRVLLNK